MSNFPIYDTMIKDVKSKDLSAKEKKDLIDKINVIDDSGIELIYVLIKIYETENEENPSSFKIPYSGKYVEGKNIQFDLSDMPLKLRQMLYKFVNIHINKMDEDNKLHKLS
jgi:hypothetical protein